MTKKPILIAFLVTQEEIDQIDSEWRPYLEYRSRSDYIRARLGIKRSYTKTEE
jgi:hypothetical protein